MSRGSAVKLLYSQIFNIDPLLLSEDSQRAYGRAILQHLLVYRPLTTSDPHPIDLHDPTSRDNSRRQPSSAAGPTDSKLARRYDVQRLARHDPSDADFRVLKDITMVARGVPTEDRAQPSLSYAVHESFLQGKPDRIRIAAIGYRPKISKLDDQQYLSEDLSPFPQRRDAPIPALSENTLLDTDAQLGRTRPNHRAVKPWEDAILQLVSKALDRGSEIVLLPEFCLPPAQSTSNFEERLKQKCSRTPNDFFLFAGTRHEERYNRGLILSKRGKDVQEWWHYKTASARGLGENVMGPHGRKLPSYQTKIRIANDYATIVIAICYDTYDPTNFLNLVLDGVKSDLEFVPKIILVPAFNPASDFVELLRDLSFLAQCTVVYVNGLHGDAHAFVCGIKLSDIVDRLWDLVDSIDAKYNSIEQELQDESDEFQRKKALNPRYVRDQAQFAWIAEKRQHQNVLQNFRNWLVRMDTDGDLKAMITVEDCMDCTLDRHAPTDRLCLRDILYYNIDKTLLKVLSDFRREFFENDDFLPEPFRRKNLARAATEI